MLPRLGRKRYSIGPWVHGIWIANGLVDSSGVELRLEVAQPICMAFVSSIQETSIRREINATL